MKKRVHAVRAVSHADKVPKVIHVKVSIGEGNRHDSAHELVPVSCRWVRNGWAVHESYAYGLWKTNNPAFPDNQNPYEDHRWIVTHVASGLMVSKGYGMVRTADNVGMRLALLLPNRSREEMDSGGGYFRECWWGLINFCGVREVFQYGELEVKWPFDPGGYAECVRRRL